MSVKSFYLIDIPTRLIILNDTIYEKTQHNLETFDKKLWVLQKSYFNNLSTIKNLSHKFSHMSKLKLLSVTHYLNLGISIII